MASAIRFSQRYQRLVVSQRHPRPLIQLHYVKFVLPRDSWLVRDHRVVVDGSRTVPHRFAQARRVFLVHDRIREALGVPDAITSTEHLSGIVPEIDIEIDDTAFSLDLLVERLLLVRRSEKIREWNIQSHLDRLETFRRYFPNTTDYRLSENVWQALIIIFLMLRHNLAKKLNGETCHTATI